MKPDRWMPTRVVRLASVWIGYGPASSDVYWYPMPLGAARHHAAESERIGMEWAADAREGRGSPALNLAMAGRYFLDAMVVRKVLGSASGRDGR